MTGPTATLAVSLPPKFSPGDPYPPASPDDPEWVFADYKDYYYGWLTGKLQRLVIHDPATGSNTVFRAAMPPDYDAMFPMGAGVVYIRYSEFDGLPGAMWYARYAVGDEAEPPVELIVEEDDPNLQWGYNSMTITKDGSRLLVVVFGSIYTSTPTKAYMVTPEPESGQSVLFTTSYPGVHDGGYGSYCILRVAGMTADGAELYGYREFF